MKNGGKTHKAPDFFDIGDLFTVNWIEKNQKEKENVPLKNYQGAKSRWFCRSVPIMRDIAAKADTSDVITTHDIVEVNPSL